MTRKKRKDGVQSKSQAKAGKKGGPAAKSLHGQS
jgi:hypothetical protein